MDLMKIFHGINPNRFEEQWKSFINLLKEVMIWRNSETFYPQDSMNKTKSSWPSHFVIRVY